MSETLLRIKHRHRAPHHSVTVELTGDEIAQQEFTADFDFASSNKENAQITWYLENYLEHQEAPAPEQARLAEQVISDVGTRLFDAIFNTDNDARRCWARLEPILPQVRIEVSSEQETGWTLPWELLQDPSTKDFLAIRAKEFVRTHPSSVRPAITTPPAERTVRILLVICRPRRTADVRFLSVARRLVAALSGSERFQIDVLRPPTYDALAKQLRDAKAAGHGYHILHFDGHGLFADLSRWNLGEGTSSSEAEQLASLIDFNSHSFSFQSIYPYSPRRGDRGYLIFENTDNEHNLHLVDGHRFASLLAETGVSLVILNACRSGRAAESIEEDEVPFLINSADRHKDADRHERVRAFGSFAQEVMDAGGIAGVLAMRYNVYVDTAARFVGSLYEALARGMTFGVAASASRKGLAANPLRSIAYDPVPLQDWIVPVVYEAAPVRLISETSSTSNNSLGTAVHAGDVIQRGNQENDLPPPPDYGFYGRDETFLDLNTAFTNNQVALLHGFAGSGKTTTAVEFARWYRVTGGVKDILSTSFEQYKPLTQVLSVIESAFGTLLKENGIQWLALSEAERRNVALQMLRQMPVIWVWDNVETVAGFPSGTESKWNEQEQQELADFLREAQQAGAKFLLTSRREESNWLKDLPVRVALPPMQMPERVLMARAIAEKRNRPLFNLSDWRPLLRFTEGNPLTLRVVVWEALRGELMTRNQIEDFVAKLRAGESTFDDEISEGRSRSLAASLNYGFQQAFNNQERNHLALLHLFHGNIDALTLVNMGVSSKEWSLPSIRGLSPEYWVALLDRAVEIGLLKSWEAGIYDPHPALPWFFKRLYDEHYPEASLAGVEGQNDAARAFAEALSTAAKYYSNQHQDGDRTYLVYLKVEELNFLQAMRIARDHRWWDAMDSVLSGLMILYTYAGRHAELSQIMLEIKPHLLDAHTDKPIAGRERLGHLFIAKLMNLASKMWQWAEAEHWAQMNLKWARDRAAPFLDIPPETLSLEQLAAIRDLTAVLNGLGNAQIGQGKIEGIAALEEDFKLSLRIGDLSGAAKTALSLGNAYKDAPLLNSLKQAKLWYRRSFQSRQKNDHLGRAMAVSSRGQIALLRYWEIGKTTPYTSHLMRYLYAALSLQHQALNLLTPDDIQALASVHHHLGEAYCLVRKSDLAIEHLQKSVRFEERQGNVLGAASSRQYIANVLAHEGRYDEALLFARAALNNYGSRPEHLSVKALIQKIEQAKRNT